MQTRASPDDDGGRPKCLPPRDSSVLAGYGSLVSSIMVEA